MTTAKTLSHRAVLSGEARRAVSGDPTVGGGHVLRSAIAASPDPDAPFLYTARPLENTDGELQSLFSLNQLAALADSWSAWYLKRGVRARDRVALYLQDSFAYSLHFHALAQIGAIAVCVNSNAPQPIAVGMIEKTGSGAVVTDREHLDRLGEALAGLPALQWLHLLEEMGAPPAAALPDSARFNHADEDPVCCLHSSGTTGVPKPVIHTHRSIVAGPQFRLGLTEPEGAVTMTALPQSHLGCIAFTSYAILAGVPLIALRDLSAADLLEQVERHRPTTVMAFGHTYSELAAEQPAPGAVDSVHTWVSLGDSVHHAHIQKILAMRDGALPAAQFYDRLGTTELGWGALLRIHTPDTERNDRCGGKPVGVAQVRVLRQDGTEAPAGEYGLLAARGPAITPGYWNSSDLTYRSKLSGYWLTGDVAFHDEEGQFFLVDRVVDAIETADGMAYSILMEEILLADVPDLADVTVVAGRHDDGVVPVAVVRLYRPGSRDAESVLAEVNTVLREHGQLELALLEFAREDDDIPLGVTGKVLKRLLRDRYRLLPGVAERRQGRTFATTHPTTTKEGRTR